MPSASLSADLNRLLGLMQNARFRQIAVGMSIGSKTRRKQFGNGTDDVESREMPIYCFRISNWKFNVTHNCDSATIPTILFFNF